MSSLLWDYLTYNTENGLLEAMVHGKKNGILKKQDYYNLTQCDSLDQGKKRM
jgi:vacuolar-type H+-ATPase subunit C/Vma6